MSNFDYKSIKENGIVLAKKIGDFNDRRQRTELWIEEIINIIKKDFVADEYTKKITYTANRYNSLINKKVLEYNETNCNERKNEFVAFVGTPKSDDIMLSLNNLLSKEIYEIITICSKIDNLSTRNENLNKSAIKPHVFNNNIFIVHGHNSIIKQIVARTVIQLNLKPIILHEQTNSGKTIIEKFEECANSSSYAIVILSDDDVGKAKNEENYNARARQNVIIELGFFLGKLGRDRVFVLKQGDIEVPSDIMGVVYNDYDGEEGGWRNKLVKEMKNVGFNIDANNLL